MDEIRAVAGNGRSPRGGDLAAARAELAEIGEALQIANAGDLILVEDFPKRFAEAVERMIDAKLIDRGGSGYYYGRR